MAMHLPCTTCREPSDLMGSPLCAQCAVETRDAAAERERLIRHLERCLTLKRE